MKNALAYFSIGLSIFFGIINNSLASSIDVSGTYSGTNTWNADTVFIVGDCDYDSLFIFIVFRT